MNKDEIKKALEICSKDEDCEKCPYCDHYRCDRALQKDSFVLITEQEQEIKRLKAENYELTKKLEARLTCDFVKTAQKQAQIDILNKLKEKKSIDKPHANIEALKASLSQSGPTYSPERLQADIRSLSSTMTIWDIDEMIKEIENDRI